MTLGEVKSEIFNLGFEKAEKYKDDKKIVPQAINRAMSIITTEVRPIIGEITIPSAENGSFDLKALASAAGLAEPLGVVAIEDANANEISSYEFKHRRNLTVHGGVYPLRVYCKIAYTPVDVNTSDEFVIQLDSEVCILLALLAASYVWLDDDNGNKATIYANEYELRRNALLANAAESVATVIGGVDI